LRKQLLIIQYVIYLFDIKNRKNLIYFIEEINYILVEQRAIRKTFFINYFQILRDINARKKITCQEAKITQKVIESGNSSTVREEL
jgi:hypothetical protein